MEGNIFSGSIVKQAALVLGVFILALITVGGILFLKATFFSGQDSSGHSTGTQGMAEKPLTSEEEAYLVESTTAPEKSDLSQKEKQSLMQDTSAPNLPRQSQ